MDDRKLYAVPLGAPYPKAFVDGFLKHFSHQPPHDLAKTTIITNSAPMARAITPAFLEKPPLLLPKILPLTRLDTLVANQSLPQAADPIRLRLELAQLTAQRMKADDGLASNGTAYDIAGSLLRLLGEMASEGVTCDTLAGLDVSDHSAYWAQNLSFIQLVEAFLGGGDVVEPEARQRIVVDALIEQWRAAPPKHPICIAGSTGSRGTTRRLMEAVAKLPNGFVVLPGFDPSLSNTPDLWSKLGDEHPQYRYARLMADLSIDPKTVEHWAGDSPAPDRQKVLSLALRPPPVTDQWITEGPNLPQLTQAFHTTTLLEADSLQAEAQAIALGIRAAVGNDKTVALVTPDRGLTRRVTAALSRWGIEPDDSAGRPLSQSAPGRLLRQLSTLNQQNLTSSDALALLKHPLVATGQNRGPHLKVARELEIWLRQNGHPFVTHPLLARWAKDSDDRLSWVTWILQALPKQSLGNDQPLSTALSETVRSAETLAAGPGGTESGELWSETAGELAAKRVEALRQAADASAPVNPRDFANILASVLQEEVRDPVLPHEDVVIRGTLEARMIDSDLVILAGLNEKTWPPTDDHDPWLNRALRRRAGLLTPDRRTGLSAHDFEQSFGAHEIWLSRTLRTDDGETVPSRWLNRLINLVSGLPQKGGPDALKAMRQRGQGWARMAAKIDRQRPRTPPAKRPGPAPPTEARPKRLSVTEIQRLIRDPYAIYARHVLGLSALPQAPSAPDARLRGIVLHEIADAFSRTNLSTPEADRDRLRSIAQDIMARLVPWPTAR
ncbi:MAG: double-strand break repair protein AddB, partial [Pseudomonadota bacterium]